MNGPPGHFIVLEGASRLLLLYTDEGYLLSRFPIPSELSQGSVDRFQVHFFQGGRFVFLDPFAGEGWVFQERTGVSNESPAGSWQPLGRFRLPKKLSECYHPNPTTHLVCRAGDRAFRLTSGLSESPLSAEDTASDGGLRFNQEWKLLLSSPTDPSETQGIFARPTWRYYPGQSRILKVP
jgi:hypothetical protein